jgi:hypothetical protein
MAQTAKNVVFSKPKATGAVWAAAEGTKLPTNAVTALDAAFETCGYISAAGITEAHELSSETVKDYGKTSVLIIDGGDEVTIEFTPIEYTNPVTQKILFGSGNVEVNPDGTIKSVTMTDDAKEVRAFIFEHVLSDGTIERDVYPRAKVTGIDTNTYSADAALGPKVTVTALASEDGPKGRKYFAEPTSTASETE